MKTKATPPAHTQNALHSLTGIDRRTIKKRLANVTPSRTENGHQLWTVEQLFAPPPDGHADITESTARRDLAVARTGLLTTEHEALRRDRIPIDDLNAVNETLARNIRGIVLASRLSDQEKQDVFAAMRDHAKAMREMIATKP